MRVILQYANQLRKVSALLVSELEQMVARMNAWAGVEHKGTGAHGDVTADSVDTASLTADAFTYSGATQTTVGAAGGASAQPATPKGYLPITLSDGTEVVIPYHTKA